MWEMGRRLDVFLLVLSVTWVTCAVGSGHLQVDRRISLSPLPHFFAIHSLNSFPESLIPWVELCFFCFLFYQCCWRFFFCLINCPWRSPTVPDSMLLETGDRETGWGKGKVCWANLFFIFLVITTRTLYWIYK